jgi:RNA polymerase sigma-70 factor (ECF subfamily)
MAMIDSEFRHIYNESGQSLYNFILWITGNRSACDDILQEVFIKVWQCSDYPHDPEERRRWLLTITRNTCLDVARKNTRRTFYTKKFTEEWYDPPGDPDAPFFWNILQELPEVERSILFLHLKIGHSYREIAEVLDISESLVRVKAFRALHKLKETLIKKES